MPTEVQANMLIFWPIILFFYAKKICPLLSPIIHLLFKQYLTRRHNIHSSDCFNITTIVLKGFCLLFRKLFSIIKKTLSVTPVFFRTNLH